VLPSWRFSRQGYGRSSGFASPLST
jgi:hypothetical protein